jgi:hypothetical protein
VVNSVKRPDDTVISGLFKLLKKPKPAEAGAILAYNPLLPYVPGDLKSVRRLPLRIRTTS